MMMTNDVAMPVREGVWLIYKKTIRTTHRPGAVAKEIHAYFDALGYEQTQTTPTMIFERGGGLASLYSPNPASQKMRVLIDMVSGGDNETWVEVRLRVNSLGSLSFAADHDFREAELEGLRLLLEYGCLNTLLSQYAADRAKWFSLVVILATLAVMFGVLAGFAWMLLF